MAEIEHNGAGGEAAEGASPSDAETLPKDSPLRRFLDVPMTVAVRLDHRPIKVRSMLALKEDSVIKLKRSAGEKVDLLLDGFQIGAGEIVVIEDMMGLRITDLLYHLGEEDAR